MGNKLRDAVEDQFVEEWKLIFSELSDEIGAHRPELVEKISSQEEFMRKKFTQEGFDIASSSELRPLGRAAQKRKNGISHAFARPGPFLMPRKDLPTVLIWENTYDPPSLRADRCYDLGRTLARLFKNDSRRIA